MSHVPRLRWIFPAVLLALVLSACSAARPSSATAALPHPSCPVAPERGKPVLCIPADGSGFYIVGLDPSSPWERGDWIMLDLPMDGISGTVPVAMFAVVESYGELAEVHLLYQREPKPLGGARARKIRKEERARLGKYVARVIDARGGRVQVDLGAQDKVLLGDVYQVLSLRSREPIGRVRIAEIGDLHAWGVPLDQHEPFREGMDAVFLREAEIREASPVSILVVNFDPRDEMSADQQSLSRSFAKDLADALAAGAKGSEGLTVRYEADERIRLGGGPEQGDAEARSIGKKYAADIVVWGAVRCDKDACVEPRYTVVDGAGLQTRSYQGADIWVERDKGGFAFKGPAPDGPLALAAAILGSAAFDAQRYADARYYLGRAVSKNVLHGADEFRGRWNLAYAMYMRGQTVGAREQALSLIQRARAANEAGWEQRGQGELVRIDMLEGKVKEARAALEAIRSWSAASHDDGVLSYALHTLAVLEARQGRVEEARALYAESLDLERRIHDVRGEAATLYQLAGLEAQQGHAGRARDLYAESLALKRRIGDVEGEAANLHNIADLDATQGHMEDARKLYAQALDLERRIGDVRGEAATLHQLAGLEAQQGGAEEARRLYIQSFDLKSRIGDVEGVLATLQDLAVLDYQQGKKDVAVQVLERCLVNARALKHVEYQANILDSLALIALDRSYIPQARNQWVEALTLYRQLQMPTKIHEMEQHLAALAIFETNIAVWRANPSLLAGGGVFITGILPHSQAEGAGLRPGDVLLRYDQTRLDKSDTLRPLPKVTDPTKIVTLELLRREDKLAVQVHGGLLGITVTNLPSNTPP
ncbi:MAG: tetratricopeptide repeat protein [Byssovorax sp.]